MQRVADVGVAAGEAWRSLTPEQKAVYEQQSVASKVRLRHVPMFTPFVSHDRASLQCFHGGMQMGIALELDASPAGSFPGIACLPQFVQADSISARCYIK